MSRCYNATKDIDGAICKSLGLTDVETAHLRALMDDYREAAGLTPYLQKYEDKEVPNEVLTELTNTLKVFKKELHNNAMKEINQANTHLASSFTTLAMALDPEVQFDLADSIASMFSTVVRTLAQKYNCSVEDVCKGTLDKNGKQILGEGFIFGQIHQRVLKGFLASKPRSETYNSLKFILDFWGPLCMHSRSIIRDTERLYLGVYKEYAKAIDAEESVEDLDEMFNNGLLDPETITTESWQEEKEKATTFSRLSDKVKSILSTFVYLDTEYDPVNKSKELKIKRNTLSIKSRIPVQNTHTILTNIFKRCPTRKAMMQELQERAHHLVEIAYGEKGELTLEDWVAYQLYAAVTGSDQLELGIAPKTPIKNFATSIYANYKKGFTLYTGIDRIKSDLIKGSYFYHRKNLNSGFSTAKGRLKYFIKNREVLNRAASRHGRKKEDTISASAVIFDAQGHIDKSLFTSDKKNIISTVLDVFKYTIQTQTGTAYVDSTVVKGLQGLDVSNKKSNTAKRDAIEHIYNALNALGIDISLPLMHQLVSANLVTKDMVNLIYQIYDKLDTKTNILTSLDDPKSQIGKKIITLADLISDAMSSLIYENRAKVTDKNGGKTTVASDQASCFFTDTIDPLIYYYNKSDIYAAREFLYDKYLYSETFYKGKATKEEVIKGKIDANYITNNLLRTIWESFDGKNNFMMAFSHSRLSEVQINKEDFRMEKLFEKDVTISLAQLFWSRTKETSDTMATYPLFILGDSGVFRIMDGPVYSIKNIPNMWTQTISNELSILNLVESVNNNLKKVGHSTIKNTNQMFKTSIIAPFLTYIEQSEEFKAREDKQQTLLEWVSAALLRGDFVDKFVTPVLENQVTEFKDKFASLGLSDYVDIYGKNNEIFAAFEHFDDIKRVSKSIANWQETLDAALEDKIRYFVYNYGLHMADQMHLMTVSTSFYKSLEDLQKRYKEVHASGYALDVYAVDPTTGDPIFSKLNKEGKRTISAYEIAIYFEDILTDIRETDPEFAKVIAAELKDTNYYKNYLKNTLTDGQSFRSLESYRKIAIAQDIWSDNEEKFYQLVVKFRKSPGYNGKFTKEQIEELDALGVVFQPRKPYLFCHETYSFIDENGKQRTLPIPVQHKCAEVILIPEFLADGSNLKHLATVMQEENIDLACSTEVVKVGCFGECNLSYKTNEKGLFVDSNSVVLGDKETRAEQMETEEFKQGKVGISSLEDMRNALKFAYKHQLDLTTYYRQSNVPLHVNDPNSIGTQMRKIFFTAMNMTDEADYTHYLPEGVSTIAISDKHSVSLSSTTKNAGQNLCTHYNMIICANIIQGFKELMQNMKNEESLSKVLSQMSINSSRDTVYNLMNYAIVLEKGENEEEAATNFLVPLFDGSICKETQANLISIFRKKVNKLMMLGGSAVQASAFGLKRKVEDTRHPDDGGLKYVCDYKKDDKGNYVLDENGERIPDNILYAECEMPFNFYYTNESGQKVELRYEDYCDEDGNLLLDNEGNALLDKDFPGMSDLVAYRIPTERSYSAMNLKIVKFTRKELGGIIKVPSAGTTISGFDFDIDKLYLLRKEFVYNKRELSDTEPKAVWDAVYKEHGNVAMGLAMAQLREANNGTKITKKGKEYTITADTPLNQLRDFISMSDYNFKEGTTLQSLFNQKAKELGYSSSFETYDYTKPALKNSKVARNNELLRLTQLRLQDKETLSARITPGGFDNSRKASKTHRILSDQQALQKINAQVKAGKDFMEAVNMLTEDDQDYKPTTALINPVSFIQYNQQNQVAGELIGVFANQNNNHIYSSMLKGLKLPKGTNIAFGNMANKGSNNLLRSTKAEQEKIDIAVAEFLAASVDAVKDPVLNDLNLNNVTASAGAVLARLGYSSLEIGALFNQPIIKELCNRYFNEHISNINTVIDEVTRDCFASDTASVTRESLTTENLLETIASYNTTSKGRPVDWITSSNMNRSHQKTVLELFKDILKASTAVNQYLKATKNTAAASVPSSIGHMYHQFFVVNKYKQSTADERLQITGWEGETNVALTTYNSLQEGFESNNYSQYLSDISVSPFAFEQCMYDLMQLFVTKICAKYYPYETPAFKMARNGLNSMTKNETLAGDTINNIHNEFILYTLSQEDNSLFNSMTIVDATDENGKAIQVYAYEYYTEIVPKKVQKWKETVQAELDAKVENAAKNHRFIDVTTLEGYNHLLYNLQMTMYETAEGEDKYDLNLKNSFSSNTVEKMKFMKAWQSLALTDKQLAQDLFIYCVYKAGVAPSPRTFIHFATPTIKEMVKVEDSRNFLQFENDLLKKQQAQNNSSTNAEFMQMYIRNNSNDYQFVYTVKSKKDTEAFNKLTIVENEDGTKDISPTINVAIEENDTPLTYLHKVVLDVTNNAHGKPQFVKLIPAIKIGSSLYYLSNEGVIDGMPYNVRSYSDSFTYTKVSILGYEKGTKNYSEYVNNELQIEQGNQEENVAPIEGVELSGVTKEKLQEAKITEQQQATAAIEDYVGYSLDELIDQSPEWFVRESLMTVSEDNEDIMSCFYNNGGM